MGLMRGFSVKRASGIPTRSFSTLKGRPQISLPTELISSTNNLAFTSPSVTIMQQAMAEAAATNDDSGNNSRSVSQDEQRSLETPSTPTISSGSRRCSNLSTGSAPSMTDNSSVSSSPSSPDSHFSTPNRTSFFSEDTLTKPSTTSIQIFVDDSVDPFTIAAPILPRRAASHSKQEHERLARRRSQRASARAPGSSMLTLTSSDAGVATADEILSPTHTIMPELSEIDEELQTIEPAVPEVKAQEPEMEVVDTIVQHPFSQELEQLTEAVEQLSAMVEDEDTLIMRERGLKRWSVGGYLDVVGDAWSTGFVSYADVVAVA